jgi:dipeptidase E
MEPQLVAIGGGGFADGPDNLLLEDYILSLANKPNPKVSFLPTASGDSEQYLLKFYMAFAKLHATASHLPLFRLTVTDLRSFILAQDVIYVGGGNTRNMLLIWREFGLDRILREAWEKGTVLCGSSAGCLGCRFSHRGFTIAGSAAFECAGEPLFLVYGYVRGSAPLPALSADHAGS